MFLESAENTKGTRRSLSLGVSKKKKSCLVTQSYWKNRDKSIETVTNQTKKKKMKGEKNMQEDLGKNKELTTENNTHPIQMVPSNRTNEGKKENHIESYEPAENYFFKESLESMNILNESARQLHTQTTSLFRVPEGMEEVRKPDHYNIEQARQNMNTIAKLIQTKINFVKVLKSK